MRKAYVGKNVPTGSKVNTNITCTIPFFTTLNLFLLSSDITNALTVTPTTNNDWVITPTNPDVTIPNSPALYIEPSTAALTNVGFTNDGQGETSGFLLYGNWAMWKGYTTEQLASNFYATPVEGCDNVFSLMWNQGQQDDGKSISVAVRKLAPST
ncbi:cytochrome p450 protein [Rutstroemia sp. NJR-2017a BVV2]|nr:cytochrome p450 protein [Rutstroemia sp. NJR-2017a BVV2]